MCSEENKYGLHRGSATYSKHNNVASNKNLSLIRLGVNSVFFSEEYRTCYADIQHTRSAKHCNPQSAKLYKPQSAKHYKPQSAKLYKPQSAKLSHFPIVDNINYSKFEIDLIM